jgi:hypothetical protein
VSSTTAGGLYDMTESGSSVDAIPEAVYRVTVTRAAPNEKNPESRTIFLTLEVVEGPLVGKEAEVNLYVPDLNKDKRGARFHWNNKIRGFFAYDSVKDAIKFFDGAPLEDGLNAVADALIGKVVTAEIGINTKEGDKYFGNNELTSTTPPTNVSESGPSNEYTAPAEEPPVAAATQETAEQPKAKVPF